MDCLFQAACSKFIIFFNSHTFPLITDLLLLLNDFCVISKDYKQNHRFIEKMVSGIKFAIIFFQIQRCIETDKGVSSCD